MRAQSFQIIVFKSTLNSKNLFADNSIWREGRSSEESKVLIDGQFCLQVDEKLLKEYSMNNCTNCNAKYDSTIGKD